MQIAPITEANYFQVAAIYQEGLDTGLASFETKAPPWEAWNDSHMDHSRMAAIDGNQMLGWAALSPTSSRCVYGGVGEVSVYIAGTARGTGVGSYLLNELIRSSEANGLWSLQSGVFPQNKGSVALHLKCGFRQIGYREKIGQRNGLWFDNLLFERRSKLI